MTPKIQTAFSREIKRVKDILSSSHFRSIVFVFLDRMSVTNLAKNNSLVYLSAAYLNEWEVSSVVARNMTFDLYEGNLHCKTIELSEPKLTALSNIVTYLINFPYLFVHFHVKPVRHLVVLQENKNKRH